MIGTILDTLHALRDAARRSTLLCTVALAAGVVMVPLSYRGGATRLDRWLLLCVVTIYVAVAAHRVFRGLHLERRLESEERYVHLADRDGLAATPEPNRASVLARAVERVREVEPADRRRALRGALRRSARSLVPPPASVAAPVLIGLALLWIRTVLQKSPDRNLLLFAAVIVVLLILLCCESILLVTRRRFTARLSSFVDHVVAWWTEQQHAPGPTTYRHRVLYRDVTEMLGLS